MNATICKTGGWLRLGQFIKFCLVGGSGVLVDMAVLYVLADPKMLVWNVTLAKLCSAEAAMLNNFLWNELWTFKNSKAIETTKSGVIGRLVKFHAICGIGILLAVLLLHVFYTCLSINLYTANLLAIVLVTIWNFGMNAVFNWRVGTSER